MSCTYPSTKLDLMICSQVPLTLGRNLAFSLCCQKSPVPCSQLGPVPTSVSAHETTSEVEGDDGICASQPHQREYHSEGKKKKKKNHNRNFYIYYIFTMYILNAHSWF